MPEEKIRSAAEIASKLTKAQRAALEPFVPFGDAVGSELKHLGLLTEKEGVWFLTPLGLDVWATFHRAEPDPPK